jgi:hypothetical protein
MKKALTVVALLAIATSAYAVPAGGWLEGASTAGHYAGPFDYTWNFTTGTDGFALGGSATWVDTFGGGQGAIRFTGADGTAPYDSSYAFLDARTLNPKGKNASTGGVDGLLTDRTLAGLFGGGNGAAGGTTALNQRWVMEATVVYEGGMGATSGVGIGVPRTGDLKGPAIWGRPAGQKGMGSDDKSWFNSTKNQSNGTTLGVAGEWYTTTMQIDYGYTNPGQFTSGYYPTPGNGSGWATTEWHSCVQWSHHAETHGADVNWMMRLGNGIAGMQDFYTNSYFTQVKLVLAAAPEPSTIGLLALGFVGLVRRRR